MRRKHDVEQLRQISAVRDLQRIAAEDKASRAAAAVRDREAAKTESERVRQEAEDGWLGILSAPSLRLDMCHLWSTELRHRDQAVSHANVNVASATSELDRRKRAWLAARMQCDVTTDLLEQAVKDRRKHREENALQDASDRYGQRAWLP